MKTKYPFKTITFIRHAQSEQNLVNQGKGSFDPDRLYGGVFDAPLTELGRSQARDIVTQIQLSNHDIFFTSTLQRAIDTARIAFEGKVPFYTTALLNERSGGVFGGKYVSELEADPNLYPYFHDEELKKHTAHWTIAPPQGESLRMLDDRSRRLFHGGLDAYITEQEHPFFVSHGLFMKSVLHYFEITCFEEYFKYDIPNCQVMRLERVNMRWRLATDLPLKVRSLGGPWK